MENRVAIVTGASRGIGRAIARSLAEAGTDIVINYAGNDKAAEETAEICREFGVEVLLAKGNVADADDCERVVKETMDKFGRIDILVNNAGIIKDNLLMRMNDEDFDKVIEINLKGTYLMMKAVSRIMMKQRYGRIINMASVSGIMGNIGQINYSASKGGVISMTKTFAREIATKGVTVNAVAPGFIATDMTASMGEGVLDEMKKAIPVKRIGKPEDIANAVKFFAGEASEYITGQVLCVDGGMCMC